MAQEQNGKLTLLYIDTDTPLNTPIDEVTNVNFRPVVCLTSNGFDGTTSEIDTTSKCSGSWGTSLDGQKGWTLTGEGNAVALTGGEEALKANQNEVFKLWRSGEEFWAAMFDEELISVRYGRARITSYSDSAPNNAVKTFSLTLTGQGEPGDQDDFQSTT